MDLERLLALADFFEKEAKKPWSKKPPGWKEKSVKKYYKTMTEGTEHPFTKCVEKIKGKVDNPKGFCGSLTDRVKNTTKWRNKHKK